MSDNLFFLIYTSRAVSKFEKLDLIDLCADSADRNKQRNVTGLLLCIGNFFLQVLEGDEKTVKNLYSTISKDSRHTQIRILYQETVNKRLFGQWSMNFLNLDESYFLELEEFAELRGFVEVLMKTPDKRSDGVIKIIKKIPKILRSNQLNLDVINHHILEE